MDIYFTKWSESCWENCWMKSCWCKSRARNRSSAPKELAAKLCLSRLSHDKDRQTFNNVQQCSTCSTIVVITSSKHPDWRTYSLDLPPSTPIGATLCAVAPTRRWPFPEAAHMAIPGHRLLPVKPTSPVASSATGGFGHSDDSNKGPSSPRFSLKLGQIGRGTPVEPGENGCPPSWTSWWRSTSRSSIAWRGSWWSE